MRLAKERIHHMAESLIARLHELAFLEVTGDRKALRESLEQTMTQELGVEDRLNAEVRRLMQPYERQIVQSVEKAEREKPRRMRGWNDVASIHE